MLRLAAQVLKFILVPALSLLLAAAVQADKGLSLFNLFNPLPISSTHSELVEDSPVRWYSILENDAVVPQEVITDQYLTNAYQLSRYQNIEDVFVLKGSKLYSLGCKLSSGYLQCPYSQETAQWIGFKESWDEKQRKKVFKPYIKSGGASVRVGSSFGHRLYTPSYYAQKQDARGKWQDTDEAIYYQQYDRPFSAWAYLSKDLRIALDRAEIHQSLSYGMVGKTVLGREAQEWAHQVPFSGPEKIPGWDTQVKNRLAIQYTGKYAYKYKANLGRFSFTTLPYVKGELGSVFVRGSMGVDVNLGINKPSHCFQLMHIAMDADNSGIKNNKLNFIQADLPAPELDKTIIKMKKCQARYFSWDIFARTEASYVAYNYLIEDGIHYPDYSSAEKPILDNSYFNQVIPDPAPNNSLYGSTQKVDLERSIQNYSLGVRMSYRDNIALSIAVYQRSRETKQQDVPHHRWGSLALEYKTENDWLGVSSLPMMLLAAFLTK